MLSICTLEFEMWGLIFSGLSVQFQGLRFCFLYFFFLNKIQSWCAHLVPQAGTCRELPAPGRVTGELQLGCTEHLEKCKSPHTQTVSVSVPWCLTRTLDSCKRQSHHLWPKITVALNSISLFLSVCIKIFREIIHSIMFLIISLNK